jgi:hypothetical protein
MQDLKTAMLRQIIINVASNNDPKMILDSEQNQAIGDLAADRMAIRIKDPNGKGIKSLVDFFPHHPLSAETFTFWETLQGMVENKTGVTRYNQGLDANSLNKTATGINQIMSASQQRIELMARFIAETGVTSLFRHLVAMNQRYIDQDQVVRLSGEPLLIRTDDLDGTYDIEVSTGLGTGNKQSNVQNMMMLMQQTVPTLMSLGLATPQNYYNCAKKMTEEMGYKNASEYIGNDPAAMMTQMGLDPMTGQPMGGMMGPPPMPGQPGIPPTGQPPMQGAQPNQPALVPPTQTPPQTAPINPRGFA